MTTWIAFLRAVNVGERKFPMAELRQVLDREGYAGVETHIQTGNVRLESAMRSHHRLEAALESVFAADRGFEVPTVAFRAGELAEIVTAANEVAAERPPEFGHYVELLRETPTEDGAALIEGQQNPGQRAFVRGRTVHLLFDMAFHSAKGPTAEVRRALGVSTNRNIKVIRTLARKWGP